jgi:hypothetical protein
MIVVPETGFVTLFTTLARTLEMSKGSDVTGTGCLMKQIFFLCACQLAYEGNDFGLCSNTLAIVDSD